VNMHQQAQKGKPKVNTRFSFITLGLCVNLFIHSGILVVNYY
jgi:hypothetical protein